ncbi:uncharacterized protein LOC142348753 isoform X2 [Convolutriloba macropyga]|uniref:uncharacterized protein LOC142348753 isoform X2 n=1 Tax=Convolutriloba macropyga TaxID=536237 RepID=UPI003F520EC3
MSFEFVKYLEEKLNQTPLEPHVKQMFQLFIIDLQDKNWQIQALKNELSSIQRAQKAAQIREGIARHIFNEQAKNVLSDITDPKSDNPVSQCRQKKQRMSGQSDSCDLQLTLCEIDTYRRNTSEHIGYNEEVVSFSLVDSSPAGSLKHSSSAGELSRSLRSESEGAGNRGRESAWAKAELLRAWLWFPYSVGCCGGGIERGGSGDESGFSSPYSTG